MKKVYKTGKRNRTTYVYRSVTGQRIEMQPGENGVTEMDIALLHEDDDEGVRAHDRNIYKLDGYLEDISPAIDHNPMLRDDRYNPERVITQREQEDEGERKIQNMLEAIEDLESQQQALIKKKYVDDRSNVDIAAEEGVTEAAIRGKLGRIHKRLRKKME
ncbi:RNA polymerase sigma factor [Salisediminibacterium selenitireducens]|nr:sigma factor-like helix-turn-helix DNA-binding protein [Salisediminibacterium selenitireducens]